jgi:SAM-dependent methyltransferase
MNGETYFFRYPLYLAVLQAMLERHPADRPFRVWSAACSTGEEAYSATFALLDRAANAGKRLEVIGSDLRPRAIAGARSAVYGQWSFRNVTEGDRAAFFEAADGGAWRIREPYRSTAQFRVRNLLDPIDEAPFDAVLLCNATLYMEAAAAQKAYETVRHCLRPDGLLMLSPTDPPPGPVWTHADEYGGWSIFRHGRPAVPAPQLPVTGWIVAADEEAGQRPMPGSSPRPAALPPRRRVAPHRTATGTGAISGGPSGTPRLRPTSPPVAAAGAAPPEQISAVGDSAEKLWNAWASGSLVAAQDELRARIFLEPKSPLWRFLNGVVLFEQGWLSRSAREIERAALLAVGLPAEESVAGLCTVADLRRMIDFWRSRHV